MMNFVRLAVVFWALLIAQSALALNCMPNDIYLDSQAEIDNFQANHGSGGVCDTVVGRLRIDGDDVSNLDGLSAIVQLGERLHFGYTPNLTNIDGLNSLQTVVGDLELFFVPVPNLGALSNLVSVGGNLELDGLQVSNLVGLSSLTSVGGSLHIGANTNLTSLIGLESLSFVGGLGITGNPLLSDTGSFSALSMVSGGVGVYDNDSLTSLSGLASISEIGQGLYISQNELLQDLGGLESLTSIGSAIEITYNDSLQNLDGLASLELFEHSIRLIWNPQLSDIGGLSGVSGEIPYIEITHSSIENLDALTGINTLGGLTLRNNAQLQNLEGLANLESVDQTVLFVGNAALTSIEGLASLQSVGGDLVFLGNHQLSSLAGLEGLTTVVNDLSIEQNDSLMDLSALNGIEHIGSHLEIRQNQSLAEIDSFQSLQAASWITIQSNPALQAVRGFDQLTSISGFLVLSAAIPNASFAGFSRITEIGDIFQLTGGGLRNLDDFINLRSVGALHLSSHGIENLNGLSSLVSVGSEVFLNLWNPDLDCRGIIPLLDDIDDGLPGPGPGPDDVPDVGGDVNLFSMPEECDTIQKIRELVTTASLTVNKDFFDDNPSPVLVEIACDSPSVLIDVGNDSASEATPARFELSRFIPGFQSDCFASEIDVPDGYVADQSDCEAISLVDGGALGCTIFNYDEDWIQSSGFESR